MSHELQSAFVGASTATLVVLYGFLESMRVVGAWSGLGTDGLSPL
jgi:hypothetical protein